MTLNDFMSIVFARVGVFQFAGFLWKCRVHQAVFSSRRSTEEFLNIMSFWLRFKHVGELTSLTLFPIFCIRKQCSSFKILYNKVFSSCLAKIKRYFPTELVISGEALLVGGRLIIRALLRHTCDRV